MLYYRLKSEYIRFIFWTLTTRNSKQVEEGQSKLLQLNYKYLTVKYFGKNGKKRNTLQI